MTSVDVLKAAALALAVMVTTLVLAFPMVAMYAWFIAPGHPQEFYTQAAQWIAPWSSHIFGPLVFFALTFRAARARPTRNATVFAAWAVGLYVVFDAGSLPLFGVNIAKFFNVTVMVSLAFKTAGALLGARLGTRQHPGR